MTIAAEIDLLTANAALWHAYDRSVKAELFSTAILAPDGIIVIDPIPLTDAALRELRQIGPIAGLVITNRNHPRAVAQFTERFCLPVFAHADSFPEEKPSRFKPVADGDQIGDNLTVIAISGAAPGEIALHSPANEGMLIVGDALINFEPYGFALLPPKYCANDKEMKRSLRKLVSKKAERMLFAHGEPILSRATERLQRLLGVDPEGPP